MRAGAGKPIKRLEGRISQILKTSLVHGSRCVDTSVPSATEDLTSFRAGKTPSSRLGKATSFRAGKATLFGVGHFKARLELFIY